ncbi:hypothetical protein TNCV_5128971 [Trichonephila clavipes]|nr:hypothetical protein TNCV_5128971 [Trichonephila clavipes]
MTVRDITMAVGAIDLSILRTFQNSGSSSPKRKEKCGCLLRDSLDNGVELECITARKRLLEGSLKEYKSSVVRRSEVETL